MADAPASTQENTTSSQPEDGNTPPTSGGQGEEQQQPQQITLTSKQLAERLERAKPSDYEDLKAKAAKFDEAEEANKSELERTSSRAEKAETRAAQAEHRLMQLEVGLDKGLTAAQARRLVGSTREEIEADADEFLKDLPAPSEGTQRVGYSVDHSATQSTPPPSKDDAARQFFGI